MDYSIFLTIAGIVALIAIVMFFQGKVNEAEERSYTFLKAINAEHGTRFPTSNGEDYHLRMGRIGFACMLFDSEKRLVVVSDKDGNCELKPLSYLRNWRLMWNQDSNGGYCDVRMNVGTNDLNRPQITILFWTKLQEGQEWSQKLDLLLNAGSA